jgi:hypothetical protein
MPRTTDRPSRGRFDWTAPHWPDDERLYAALLDALTRDLIEIAGTEREIVANAEVDPEEMRSNQARLAREEREEARRELGSFRAALEDARARGGELGEVPYDAADRAQDDMADALIQYLVRPGYAEVRTEEPSPGRYVYHVRVDWAKLRKLAAELGYTI